MRGREYRPKQTRLVIYLKNLDLCYVDAWGCCEIVELLLQLVQRQGFYNDNGSNAGLNVARNSGGSNTSATGRSNKSHNSSNGTGAGGGGGGSSNSNLEWINVSGLQICGSISQQTTTAATANASLVKIAPRYLAINHMLHVGYPSQQDMLAVIQRHLEHLLLGRGYGDRAAAHFKGLNIQNVQYISEGLMEFYAKVCAQCVCLFGCSCVFTPKRIIYKLRHLCVYVFALLHCSYNYPLDKQEAQVERQLKPVMEVLELVVVVVSQLSILTINFHRN